MIRTFHIDDSTPKAKAFLAFIKSLEFVTEEENDQSMISSSQLEELEMRRTNRLNGKSSTHSWEEVREFVKKSR